MHQQIISGLNPAKDKHVVNFKCENNPLKRDGNITSKELGLSAFMGENHKLVIVLSLQPVGFYTSTDQINYLFSSLSGIPSSEYGMHHGSFLPAT